MNKRIEQKAATFLEEAGVRLAPVPVDVLARREGAVIRYRMFDGDVSGLLLRTEDEKVIAVHSQDSKVRQRFTIAHELGHLRLHKGNRVIVEHLSRGVRVNWRDGASSGATDWEEIEANQFAAAVLMPQAMIDTDFSKLAKSGMLNDQIIEQLARRYAVSSQAMGFRLRNLALIDPT